MKLIEEATQKEVKLGDTVTSFKGETGVLKSFNARRVYVQFENNKFPQEYFPSVIGCSVVPEK